MNTTFPTRGRRNGRLARLALVLVFASHTAFCIAQSPDGGIENGAGTTQSPQLAQANGSPDSSAAQLFNPLPSVFSADHVRSATQRWSDDIAELEALDHTEADPENAVLLLGSSSIRLWKGATSALQPYPIIRRGYGGARFSDLALFAERLISPHDYRAVVIFVGNDIAGSEQDREVVDVEKMVRYVVGVARKQQPNSPILLVEVTPTPVRFHVWPEIRKLNAMLREVALTEPHVYFVPTAESYLDPNDQPRPELFRDDNLHQNEEGYELWANLILRRLNDVLPESTTTLK